MEAGSEQPEWRLSSKPTQLIISHPSARSMEAFLCVWCGGGALVRHQQDWEATLLSCRSIRVGTLTCGRELWAVTVKKKIAKCIRRK